MSRVRVILSLEPKREYEVEFGDGGKVRVWALFERSPVNRRGHYQSDSGAREINAYGPTGLRAIKLASRELDTRAALETETV